MTIAVHEFVAFCKHQHDVECNQKYDKKLPYSFHLELVAKQVDLFQHLIPSEKMHLVLCGCYGHDLIEDARLTYHDIIQKSGSQELAEIIYCCTEERGRNRAERHSENYFRELHTNQLALFVKLCDIMANVKYSLLTNSSMYDKYKKEYPTMKNYLYCKEYDEMFGYIEKLLYINK